MYTFFGFEILESKTIPEQLIIERLPVGNRSVSFLVENSKLCIFGFIQLKNEWASSRSINGFCGS